MVKVITNPIKYAISMSIYNINRFGFHLLEDLLKYELMTQLLHSTKLMAKAKRVNEWWCSALTITWSAKV